MIGTYPRFSWVGDSVLGGIGGILLGVWTLALAFNPWALLPFVGLVGSLYLIGRAFWLQTLSYSLNDEGLLTRQAFGVPPRALDLAELESADLHYLGTLLRGARGKTGMFILRLKGSEGTLRIESKVSDFHKITTAALKAFADAGNTISLATFDNADALDIQAGLTTKIISRPL